MRNEEGKFTAEHGLTSENPAGTPEYRAWRVMKNRCLNPHNQAYARYGGRGVKVHSAWISDPVAFIAHMGPKPTPDHTIDRFPDPNGDYEPGNVRWATPAEQARNRRNSRISEWDVRFIRLWLERGHSQGEIARAFNINQSDVSAIKLRRRFKDVA